jgi:hypothetical protein
VRAVRFSQIGADRVGLSTGGADFGDKRFRLLGGAAVVNDDAGAGGASSRAAARPMPRDAPVTSAVLLIRSVMVALLSGMRKLFRRIYEAVLPPFTLMI